MTPLSPTALEEAAKAVEAKMEGPGNLSSTGAATAAITAYLAQREKEGFVEVPVEPTIAMIEAGCRERVDGWPGVYDDEERDEIREWVCKEGRAMLAASQEQNDASE